MFINPIQNDQYSTIFTSTCTKYFKQNPYLWQVEVGATILCLQANGVGVKQLCVRPTGGGKTLLFAGVACCLKGITLCITPLLSLGTDQTHNLLRNTKNNSSITAFHLDEISPNVLPHIIHGVLKPNHLNDKTVILYSSPQFLVQHQDTFLHPILPMIRFVVIDEIHLVSHFGSSFRKEFSALKDVLFKKISNHIPVLMLTATCNNWVYQSIQQILGVTINQVHWPSGEQMRHRSVAINVSYGTKSTSFITKSLKKNLMEREDYKILVYSNSRNHIVDISEKLKSNFLDCDECLNNIRLVTLIGTMTKEEKAAYIRLFVHNGEHPISPRIRILCATSGVGNAGIDCRHIKTVYRVGFPPSILDLAQEKGRAGRCCGASPSIYSYNVCVSLESFIYLFKRIHNPSDSIINEAYRQQQLQDMFHVAKILMGTTTCLAVACEQALGNPLIPSLMVSDNCGHCTACTKQHLVMPFSRSGIKHVLFDLFIDGPLVINSSRNMEAVVHAIRHYPSAGAIIFHSSNKRIMSPSNIKKVLLILIVAGIMSITYNHEKDDIVLGLARGFIHDSDILSIEKDDLWEMINTL